MNNKKNTIDLHVHTNKSDGSRSPTEIVSLAQAYGLRAIAITDHNTMDGVEDCMFAALDTNLEIVAGVEISVEYQPELHILAYFFGNSYLSMQTWLYDLHCKFENAGQKVLKKLKEMGYNIDSKYVLSASHSGNINIHSIAAALVKRRYFRNEREAVLELLSFGQPAYVPFRPSIEEALTQVRKFGGIPVLAHPFIYSIPMDELEILIADMKQKGLMGLEVYHSEASDLMKQTLENFTDKYNLVKTGGSDFHGDLKPGIEIGVGRDNLSIPYDILENLKALTKI